MRPRKQNRHLPACLYLKHGAYWWVKQGKWHHLGRDYADALQQYTQYQTTSFIKRNGMTKLIDRVLDVHLKFISANTAKLYQQAAQRLKIILAEFEPHQIKPKHIAAIKMNLAHTPIMCNRILAFLRIVFNYAVEWELIDNNPCIGIRKHKEKPRTRYITDEEFNALLKHLSDPMKNLFRLLYLTGQRIGDVLRINKSDLHQEGIYFKQEKTGAKLLIKMNTDIKEVLSAIQPNHRGFFFYTDQDNPLSYKKARYAFIKAAKAANINDATIHDLRAKSLTDADSEGKDAQKLGGHRDQRMTARYLRGRKPTQASAPNLPQTRKSIRHPAEKY